METPDRSQSQDFDRLPSGSLRERFADAMRFWEPGRAIYNCVLSAVSILWFATAWSHFRPAFTLSSLLRLALLALLANICYCAAYLVDIPMQYSAVAAIWSRRRRGLWLMGTLLAVVVASYWINDEIYPFVR